MMVNMFDEFFFFFSLSFLPFLFGFNRIQFGSILQFTLTEIPYNEINGFNFIESDANRITPQFLDLWLLHDYKTITDCSCHVKSKDPLPRELHDKLRKGKKD